MPSDSGVTSSSNKALDLAAQHAGLHRRADGDALVGVDALERLLADEVLHRLLNRRKPR